MQFKINYEGGATHNLFQILLGVSDRENLREIEIYRVSSRINSSGTECSAVNDSKIENTILA